ncbi:Crp/Fnr family transcriptional regulator [Flavobacterium sp. 14A]|uniref:Crp/Fnr family transcriptional regulator n=1 Tax=Flavobacterium sp. 14A TaxID=2735896 RepID=UPI00156F1C87|nr:Crp/Fnr family transcriptional regulator [Flavobacterium sp. 14A]NRT10602.1 CRP-like cAMP-binding protein [Flavobacterium sp. 14A]
MHQELTLYLHKNIKITAQDLEKVLSCFQSVSVRKNEILLEEGKVSQYNYFVKKGCLRIFYINNEGKDRTRYIAFENQFVTALVSFITKEPAQETIQAVEDSELLAISHDDFRKLMVSVPAWKDFYNLYLEKAYVNNSKRMLSFSTLDATERYSQLFQVNPDIVKRLPNKIVASYINISQETLSRIKSKI